MAALDDAGLTVIVTVSVALNTPSDTVSIRTYVPGPEKLAVVLSSSACAIVTAAGTAHHAPHRRGVDAGHAVIRVESGQRRRPPGT